MAEDTQRGPSAGAGGAVEMRRPLALRIAALDLTEEMAQALPRLIPAVMARLATGEMARLIHDGMPRRLELLTLEPADDVPPIKAEGVEVALRLIPGEAEDERHEFIFEHAEIVALSAAKAHARGVFLEKGLIVVAEQPGDGEAGSEEEGAGWTAYFPAALAEGGWRREQGEPFDAGRMAERLARRLFPPASQEMLDRLSWCLENKELSRDAGRERDFTYGGPIVGKPPGKEFRLFTTLRDCFVSGAQVDAQFRHEAGRAPEVEIAPLPRSAAANPTVVSFFDAFRAADELATPYGEKHRSSVVWIYMLAAVALSLAAAALALKHDFPKTALTLTVFEALILFMIFWVVRNDNENLWQGRWVDTRLLAELLRPMCYLALFNRNVPTADVWRQNLMLHEMETGKAAHASPETWFRSLFGLRHHDQNANAWVLAYFDAVRRSAGFLGAPLDGAELAAAGAALKANLIQDQLVYHRRNAIRMERLAESLELWAARFFALTALCVLAKIVIGVLGALHVLEHHNVWEKNFSPWFGWLAVFFPAMAAAFFAVRAHCEVEIVAQRSRGMLARLEHIGARMSPATPLTRRQLGRLALATASEMLHDVRDWASIFAPKKVEAG